MEQIGDLLLTLSRPQRTNFIDVIRREPRAAIALTVRQAIPPFVRPVILTVRHSALCERIAGVVFGGAEKQVIWSHAGWIVATMKNAQAVRDRLVGCQLKRDPMRSLAAALKNALTIAITGATTSPQPARICFNNLRPEPLHG